MSESGIEDGRAALQWSGWTHRGRFRTNNEDAFLALTFDARQIRYLGKTGAIGMGEGDCVFAVSDGMGGANAGEFASRIAVEKIGELMTRSFPLAAAGFHVGGHDFLEQLVEQIHREMVRQGRAYEETSGMGATLTLCWVTPRKLYFAHVGDSRLYFLPREGGIRQVSEDHTHVGWLQRTGRISAAQARFHPRRNQLQQVLGGNQRRVDPQLGTIEYESGDRLVLRTDGVTDALSDASIERLVREPPARLSQEAPANRLVLEGMDSASRDNLTAIVVEFGAAP
ncbi:MAG: PP2C family protein-serine/threonine phosphatase [Opitutales bacterium]